ncbi:MAG: ATPase [Prevotellaceae bacterium]|jgi:N-acetylglucosamine kinase-like BadF-type ATPase|nr:ATPase [Prevotellaceae bacterium]
MILIADSGSTKTAWKFIDNRKNADEMGVFYTEGINPFYQNSAEIVAGLRHCHCGLDPQSPEKGGSDFRQNDGLCHCGLDPQSPEKGGFDFRQNDGLCHCGLDPQSPVRQNDVTNIFFYGAGCHFPDKKETVRQALQQFFPTAEIEINNDLLAACRALFGKEAGIACILGTGSNSCFYDGEKIAANVSPLGYILGDEGSGAVLGKLLVADMLKNQLPETLKNKFLAQYETSTADILDNVYKRPFPNRYLAKFAQFIGENRNEEAIYNLVYRSFRSFFERNVMQYERYPVAFIGSVAFYFRDILEKVADDLGLNISKIEQSPMEGLCAFHKNAFFD